MNPLTGLPQILILEITRTTESKCSSVLKIITVKMDFKTENLVQKIDTFFFSQKVIDNKKK